MRYQSFPRQDLTIVHWENKTGDIEPRNQIHQIQPRIELPLIIQVHSLKGDCYSVAQCKVESTCGKKLAQIFFCAIDCQRVPRSLSTDLYLLNFQNVCKQQQKLNELVQRCFHWAAKKGATNQGPVGLSANAK
jgi:hypothetical protein